MKNVIILLIILFDQFTKTFLSKVNFPLIHYAENRGIFFGMPLNPYFVIAISLIVLCGLAYYFLKEKNMALGAVFSGVLSNSFDRVILGYTRDFIDLKIIPLFNFADLFIVVGVVYLFARFLK